MSWLWQPPRIPPPRRHYNALWSYTLLKTTGQQCVLCALIAKVEVYSSVIWRLQLLKESYQCCWAADGDGIRVLLFFFNPRKRNTLGTCAESRSGRRGLLTRRHATADPRADCWPLGSLHFPKYLVLMVIHRASWRNTPGYNLSWNTTIPSAG